MSKWTGRSQGTLFGYKIFVFFIRNTSLPVAYFVLELILPYYFLFAGKAKKGLYQFYEQGLKRSRREATRLIYKNFHTFGQTLLDRIAFLAGKGDRFQLTFEHEAYLVRMQEEGKGGILLSAHLGNWEMAGNLLRGRITPAINIVMLDAEVEKIKEYLDEQTGGSRFRIIAIKEDLSHVIKISNALKKNEFVAIHADRYLEGARWIERDFFGKKARFPLGPFLIASRFDAPVTFVYGVKTAASMYHLSATVPLKERKHPEAIAQLFVEELEQRVLRNPEQWFNYFPFYEESR